MVFGHMVDSAGRIALASMPFFLWINEWCVVSALRDVKFRLHGEQWKLSSGISDLVDFLAINFDGGGSVGCTFFNGSGALVNSLSNSFFN